MNNLSEPKPTNLSATLVRDNVTNSYIDQLLSIYKQFGLSRELLHPIWQKLKLILESLITYSQKFMPYSNLVNTTLLANITPFRHDKISEKILNDSIQQILNFTIASLTEKTKDPSVNLHAKIKGILLEAVEELAFSAMNEQERHHILAFRREELVELVHLTQSILKSSNQHTKFIFIGRSPLWIYFIMKEMKINCEMFCFPISGAIYSYDINHEKPYIDFLRSKYDILSLSKNSPLELCVIDIIDSGRTLDDFCKYLKMVATEKQQQIKITKFKIYQHGRPPQLNPLEKAVEISSKLFEKITCKHRCYAAYTPGIVFYPHAWKEWQQLTFDIINPPVNDHAKQRIAAVQKFVQDYFNNTNQAEDESRSLLKL